MDSDAGGWLWFVIDVLMVAVLAVALIYATVLWRRRRSSLEQLSERATAQLYEREAERERNAEAARERRARKKVPPLRGSSKKNRAGRTTLLPRRFPTLRLRLEISG